MLGSFVVFVSLIGSSIGQIEPANSVTPLVIESETILHLLRTPSRQASCILQIVPPCGKNTSLTKFWSNEQRRSLPESAFHDAYVPIINQPEVTDAELKGLERVKLLALQLLRRLQSAVSSHVRFVQCESAITFVPSTFGNQAFSASWTGQYVRQIDKHFFVGEEHVLEQVLRRPQVQKLRWPIGIIVRPPFTGFVRHGAPISEKSHQPIIAANFAEVLFVSHHGLSKYLIHSLPSNFGVKASIDGRVISTMCHSDTMAVTDNRMDKRAGKYVGYVINFIVLASKFYNFSYALTLIQLQEAGPPQNELSKTMEALRTEEMDVILASPVYIGKDEFATFSRAVVFAGVVFFTSYPQTSVADDALLYPFSRLVWCLIGLSFLGFVLSFYLALYISTVPCLKDGSMTSKLLQSFWLAYSIMLEQSYCTPGLQRSRTLQLLATLGLMGFLVTEIAYGSDLVSYMTMPDFTPMPQTFGELAARNDVRIKFSHYFGTDALFFRDTTSPVYSKIRDRYKFVQSIQKCLTDALNTSDTACLIFEEAGLLRISRNFTMAHNDRMPLQKSKESVLAIPIAIMYPKFYKFSFELNEIFGFIDTGHLDVWGRAFHHYHKAKSIRWIKEDENREIYDLVCKSNIVKPMYEPFPFRVIQSIWWLHIAGMLFASTVFLAERTWFHACESRA